MSFSNKAPPGPMTLRRADLRLTVCVDQGASITEFAKGTQDLLRNTSPAALATRDPQQLACFPLIPYSNRIADGAFKWGTQTVQLARNFGEHPHSIHGCAWQVPWQLEEQSAHTLRCSYQHQPSAHEQSWPWAFQATQSFALQEDGCVIALSLINEADTTMPAGLGLHPYFFCDDQTELHAQFDGEWPTTATGLPTQWLAYNASRNPWPANKVARRPVDCAFTGRKDHLEICWPDRPYRLRLLPSANLPFTVVYIPEHEDYFCVEPVSHMPNAHNRTEPSNQTGLQHLAPGESMQATLTMRIVPAR